MTAEFGSEYMSGDGKDWIAILKYHQNGHNHFCTDMMQSTNYIPLLLIY